VHDAAAFELRREELDRAERELTELRERLERREQELNDYVAQLQGGLGAG
jgi:predicted  nucleic acid-binding Zn-ribbon protein